MIPILLTKDKILKLLIYKRKTLLKIIMFFSDGVFKNNTRTTHTKFNPNALKFCSVIVN